MTSLAVRTCIPRNGKKCLKRFVIKQESNKKTFSPVT